MKKYIPSLIAAAFLIGCGGGGGGSSSSNSQTATKTYQVLDGYVVGATVCDEKGNCYKSSSYGMVEGNFEKNSTLFSTGGKIDTNLNGIADADEPDAPDMGTVFDAKLINPLTTLIVQGADINKLSEILEVSAESILNENPLETNNVKLLKAYQILYPVLKESKVSQIVEKINSYNKNKPVQTELPAFDDENTVSGIVYLAEVSKSVLSDEADKKFVDYVLNSDVNDVITLDMGVENIKKDLSVLVQVKNNENENNEENLSENNISETNITSGNSQNVSQSSTQSVSTSHVQTDLPDFDSDNVEYIPTHNEPVTQPSVTYEPVPYVMLNGKKYEVEKKSDMDYEIKTLIKINKKYEDFNLSKMTDVNLTPIYGDYTVTPDGFYTGTILININDLNDTDDMNLTFKNVNFQVVGNKLIKINFNTSTKIDLNSTNLNKTENFTPSVDLKDFDINLTKVIENTTTIKNSLKTLETNFSDNDHKYDYTLDVNFSGRDFKLKTSYFTFTDIIPKITLDDDYFVLEENKEINLSVGKVNKPDVDCKIENASYKCVIDSAKNIYIQGTTPNSEKIESLTLKVSDKYGYEDTKDISFAIVKPMDNPVVLNWPLSSDYNASKIVLSGLNGNISTSNKVSVYSNIDNLPTGVSENNVTYFIFKDKTSVNSNTNYFKFTFDYDAYKHTAFKIVNDDNKTVIIRVDDYSPSNNVYYFK